MLQKYPKSKAVSWVKKGAAFILFAEAAAFGLTYIFYRRVNTDRDFRLNLYNNYPWVLDKYYSLGEYLSGDKSARQLDLAVWTQEQKIK